MQRHRAIARPTPRLPSLGRQPCLSSSRPESLLPPWCLPSPRSAQRHPAIARPTPRLPNWVGNPACQPAGRRVFFRLGIYRHRGQAAPPGDSQTNTATAESGTPTLPVIQTAGESSSALVSTVTQVSALPPGDSQTNTATAESGTPTLPVNQPAENLLRPWYLPSPRSSQCHPATARPTPRLPNLGRQPCLPPSRPESLLPPWCLPSPKSSAVPPGDSQIGIVAATTNVPVLRWIGQVIPQPRKLSATVRTIAIACRLSATEMVLVASRR